jgi:galactokinase
MGIESKSLFEKHFHCEPTKHFFSPGRANLIGEYTDIAGGHVLPLAIQLGIDGSYKERKDRLVRVFSLGDEQTFSLDKLEKSKTDWINYVIGVLYCFKNHGIELTHGFDLALNSDLPTASGLSSSAALEDLIGTIVQDDLKGIKEVTDWDVVKIGKETENTFIGLNSGILDQFSCKFGRKGMCMMLDTKTLEFSYAPLDLKNNDLVIMNSAKSRSLTESKYNVRVQEVKEGLEDLKPYLSFADCCSIKYEDFLKYQDKIKNKDAAKRIKHLITDNNRVLKSAALLKEGKIDDFCKLLNEGHASMRDDFESSGFELDTLVDLALKAGAKGARMTGGGFAGCALFISDKRDTRRIMDIVEEKYKAITGREGKCYLAEASDGAKRVI